MGAGPAGMAGLACMAGPAGMAAPAAVAASPGKFTRSCWAKSAIKSALEIVAGLCASGGGAAGVGCKCARSCWAKSSINAAFMPGTASCGTAGCSGTSGTRGGASGGGGSRALLAEPALACVPVRCRCRSRSRSRFSVCHFGIGAALAGPADWPAG